MHTTIRLKYVVFLYLLFLLCTTIPPRLRVSTYLFFLHAHNHSIKIYGPLPFIITFVHDHWIKKIRVFIYIFIIFLHDRSTKLRGHSYSLTYSYMNCVYISNATYIALLIYSYTIFKVELLLYFVSYVHGYMKSCSMATKVWKRRK